MTGAATGPGLRERKRARTRAQIVAAAARLFGEHGFEHTAVVEIARAAEVSEQTVYNHFPTKEDLVLDRDDEVRRRFVAAVSGRAPGSNPAAALREPVLALAEDIRALPPEELRGSIGHLAAVSPAVRRLTLESTDRLATELAAALGADGTDPAWAKIQGVTLAWLSQTIIDESGRLVRRGDGPDAVADAVRAAVSTIVDHLEESWPASHAPGRVHSRGQDRARRSPGRVDTGR